MVGPYFSNRDILLHVKNTQVNNMTWNITREGILLCTKCLKNNLFLKQQEFIDKATFTDRQVEEIVNTMGLSLFCIVNKVFE